MAVSLALLSWYDRLALAGPPLEVGLLCKVQVGMDILALKEEK